MKKVLIFSLLLVLLCGPLQARTTGDVEPTDGDSTPVVISSKPEPEGPEHYQGPEMDVTVVLKAIFRKDGEVTDITFREVRPDDIPKVLSNQLSKHAKKAAQKIKFTPATKDGHPVSMYMQLEYNFHLY